MDQNVERSACDECLKRKAAKDLYDVDLDKTNCIYVCREVEKNEEDKEYRKVF